MTETPKTCPSCDSRAIYDDGTGLLCSVCQMHTPYKPESQQAMTIDEMQWYRLCDALNTAPDTPVDDVLDKVETLQKLLTRCRKDRHDLLVACKVLICCFADNDKPGSVF